MHPEPVPASIISGRATPAARLLNHANGLFDDQFRLRPRDQNVGRDLEFKTEKFLTAGDVLQRLACGSPIYHSPEFRQKIFRRLLVEIDDQVGSVKASRFGQQSLRVQQVVGHGPGAQTLAGFFKGLGDRHANFPALC